jgi:transcriptional regulator with XRE-family HTH domain
MTQAQLAEAAAITPRMVRAYERDGVNPPASVLPGLASALEVSVDALLGQGGEAGIELLGNTLRRRARRSVPPQAKSRPRLSRTDFGKRLAALRRARGLTQEEFGGKVGISQRMVAYYEARNGNPPLSLLPRFADALDVGLDELFGRTTPTSAEVPKNLRLWRRFQGLQDLSPEDRRTVLRFIQGLRGTKAQGRAQK